MGEAAEKRLCGEWQKEETEGKERAVSFAGDLTGRKSCYRKRAAVRGREGRSARNSCRWEEQSRDNERARGAHSHVVRSVEGRLNRLLGFQGE